MFYLPTIRWKFIRKWLSEVGSAYSVYTVEKTRPSGRAKELLPRRKTDENRRLGPMNRRKQP